MQKINFSDFSDKNVVSGLRRSLLLDTSQFEGIPAGKVQLKMVKPSKIDAKNTSTNIENLKYIEFQAVDLSQIESIKAVKGLTESMRDQMIANIPRVYFRVDLQGGNADNAQENFKFIVANNLESAPNNKILEGLKFGVTWQYDDPYHDVLGLVVTSFEGVKVIDGKTK